MLIKLTQRPDKSTNTADRRIKMKTAIRPVCVIVRDGWGHNENHRGNAVLAARTPHLDAYLSSFPWTLLQASGEAVGLPGGYQGSSEVGHLNMGAGRIVIQELKRIDDALRDGSFFESPRWAFLMNAWFKKKSRLHLLGLLQDEGVHAHQEHLFKIMARARSEWPDGEIVVHPFLDGRDTPPRSCLEYLAKLGKFIGKTGKCSVGTIMGRYYAMDRSREWALTDKAYNCLVAAEGRRAPTAQAAVAESYQQDQTPDNVEMFDEYIPPYCIGNYAMVGDGDCVLHTNYRQDRAIQLSKAFVDPDYPGTLRRKPADLTYLGMTQYYDEFDQYLMEPMVDNVEMNHLLGEVISAAGFRQLRISETQKYRHVTSFFNGKSTTPYANEDDVEIKGRFDPAMFASHPEMEAYRITEDLLIRLRDNPYQFILVNFANGDMVGHTGNFEAARKAIEVVDECLGKLVGRLLELDFHVLITADHGNAEQMIDYETDMVKTSHTTFPVECIYAAKDSPGKRLIKNGKLSDIAPTVLRLLNLDIPTDMTAQLLTTT
jgi:2,3-bisphosphoglycerate-independent phosphoglycerate mutase